MSETKYAARGVERKTFNMKMRADLKQRLQDMAEQEDKTASSLAQEILDEVLTRMEANKSSR